MVANLMGMAGVASELRRQLLPYLLQVLLHLQLPAKGTSFPDWSSDPARMVVLIGGRGFFSVLWGQ